jgi:hypothetical protein
LQNYQNENSLKSFHYSKIEKDQNFIDLTLDSSENDEDPDLPTKNPVKKIKIEYRSSMESGDTGDSSLDSDGNLKYLNMPIAKPEVKIRGEYDIMSGFCG